MSPVLGSEVRPLPVAVLIPRTFSRITLNTEQNNQNMIKVVKQKLLLVN